MQTPEAFGRRFAIDVRVNSEVTAIHPERGCVEVKGPDGKVYEESYGEKPSFLVVHAGLEVGCFFATKPDLDAVSIGPNCYVEAASVRDSRETVAKAFLFTKKRVELIRMYMLHVSLSW